MTRRRVHIATIGGDGIGPEVIEAAVPVIDAAVGEDAELRWDHLPLGAEHFLETGESLTDERFRYLRDDVDAIVLGALGDVRIPNNEHARDLLLGLRFRLELYINFRPCTLYDPQYCPLRDKPDGTPRRIDFAIFRENTEGAYLGRGTATDAGTPQERQVVEEVHTATGVSRIVRAAFEWAARRGRRRVTIADKSNAIPGHRLWRRIGEEIAPEFPEQELEFFYVDALVMEMVRDPERFDVIVTNNLLGDILSDLGAQLVGGLGLAASANLHPGRTGLFEPVHGSAPPLAGTGQANPFAAILSGALMLEDLGLTQAADRVRGAITAAIRHGMTTPDLGGGGTTIEVANWLLGHLRG